MNFSTLIGIIGRAAEAGVEVLMFSKEEHQVVVHSFTHDENKQLKRVGSATSLDTSMALLRDVIKENQLPLGFDLQLQAQYPDSSLLISETDMNGLVAASLYINDEQSNKIKVYLTTLAQKSIPEALSLSKEMVLASTKVASPGLLLVNGLPKDNTLRMLYSRMWPKAVLVNLNDTSGEELLNISRQSLVIAFHSELEPVTALLLYVEKMNALGLHKEAIEILQGSLSCISVRKQCGQCAKPTAITPDTRLKFPVFYQNRIPDSYQFSRGCPECGYTSYRGYTILSSFFVADNNAKKLIESSLQAEPLYQHAKSMGYQSLYESSIQKLTLGLSSSEEVLKALPPIPTAMQKFLEQGKKAQNQSSDKNTNLPKDHCKNVLIVEDDEDQREVLRMVFSKEGYTVQTAENGLAAMQMVQNSSIDVILSDINMPEMNGRELVKLLKSHDTYRSIPVLMLTASSNPEHEGMLLEEGADDYCAKNVRKKVLLMRVEKLLQKTKSSNNNPLEHFLSE